MFGCAGTQKSPLIATGYYARKFTYIFPEVQFFHTTRICCKYKTSLTSIHVILFILMSNEQVIK